jgi:hypothetical protein
MHPLAGALQNESHGLQNIERFWQASLGDYFPGDSGVAANRRVRDVRFCLSPHLRVNRRPRLKPYRIGRVGVV